MGAIAELPVPEGGAIAALPVPGTSVTPERADIESFTATAGPLRRGFRSGMNQVGGMLNNLIGQSAESLGLTEFAEDRFREAQRFTDFAEAVGPDVKDLGQVKDFQSLVDFAAGSTGSAVATSLPVLGAAVGLRRPVAGVIGGAGALEAGEQVGTLRADPNVAREDILPNALIKGGIGGTLELLGATGRAARTLARPSRIRRPADVVDEAVKGLTAEGVTEAAQDVTGQLLHKQVSPGVEFDPSRVATSAAAGMFGGGALAGGAAAVKGAAGGFAKTTEELRTRLGKVESPPDPDDIPEEAFDPSVPVEKVMDMLEGAEGKFGDYWQRVKDRPEFAEFKDVDITDPESRAEVFKRVKSKFNETQYAPHIKSALGKLRAHFKSGQEAAPKKSEMRTQADMDILDKMFELIPEQYRDTIMDENAGVGTTEGLELTGYVRKIAENPHTASDIATSRVLRRVMGPKFNELIEYAIDRIYEADEVKAMGKRWFRDAFKQSDETTAGREGLVQDAVRTYMRPQYLANKEMRSVAMEELTPKLLDYVEEKGEKSDYFMQLMDEAFGQERDSMLERLDEIREMKGDLRQKGADRPEVSDEPFRAAVMLQEEELEEAEQDKTPASRTAGEPRSDARLGVPFMVRNEEERRAAKERMNTMEAEYGGRRHVTVFATKTDVPFQYVLEMETTNQAGLSEAEWKDAADRKGVPGFENGAITVKTDDGKTAVMSIVRLTSLMMRREGQQTKEAKAEYVGDMVMRGLTSLLATKKVAEVKAARDQKTGEWNIPASTLVAVTKKAEGEGYDRWTWGDVVQATRDQSREVQNLRGAIRQAWKKHGKPEFTRDMLGGVDPVNETAKAVKAMSDHFDAIRNKEAQVAAMEQEAIDALGGEPSEEQVGAAIAPMSIRLRELDMHVKEFTGEKGDKDAPDYTTRGLLRAAIRRVEAEAERLLSTELTVDDPIAFQNAEAAAKPQRGKFEEDTGQPRVEVPKGPRGPGADESKSGPVVTVKSAAFPVPYPARATEKKLPGNPQTPAFPELKDKNLPEPQHAIPTDKLDLGKPQAPRGQELGLIAKREAGKKSLMDTQKVGLVRRMKDMDNVQWREYLDAVKKSTNVQALKDTAEFLLGDLYNDSFTPEENSRVEKRQRGFAAIVDERIFDIGDGPFSAMNVAKGPIDDKEQARVRAYVEKVLGKAKTKVLFEKMAHAGEFAEVNGEEVLKIAIDALDPMSVAYHEALHGLFARLIKADKKAAATLLRAASAPAVQARLKELLKDHPRALEQLADPEESLAYMYQFWASGKKGLLAIGPGTKTWFDKVKGFLRTLAGLWAEEFNPAMDAERTGMLLDAFHDGAFADRSDVAQVLRDRFPGDARETMDKAFPWVGRMMDKFVWTAQGAVRDMNLKPLTDVMDKFHTMVGGEAKAPGWLQAKHVEFNRRANQVAEVLAGMSELEQKAILRELRSGKDRTSEAAKRIERVLDAAWHYMDAAGVKAVVRFNKDGSPVYRPMRKIEKNYFPRMFDETKVKNNMGQFLSVMARHGVEDPTTMWVKLSSGLTETDPREDAVLGVTLFTPSINERVLSNIPDSELEPFLNDDLFGTLSSYLARAARRAEYTKRFGNAGEVINEAREKAREMGMTDAQERTFMDAVKAMEGTLGANMSNPLRQVYGALTTYQNIRLLPLALFSQVVDPFGIAVRGGTMEEAFSAFKRGLTDLAKLSKDDAYYLAKTVGAINIANDSQVVGDMYSSQFMPSFQRRLNEKFFRYNGMESWNRSMRVAAAAAAEQFIIRHVEKPTKDSARYLAELDLTADDVAIQDGKIVLSQKTARAINTWVDQAIIRPNAALRPIYMSDPNWILVSHLKQYTYLFQKVIMARVYSEFQHGNYSPAYTLAGYVPIIIASDVMRTALTPGQGDDRAKAGWDVWDWLWRGIQRAALFGPGQFVLDAGGDASRGVGIESLAGPTAEQLMDFVRESRPGGRSSDELMRAVPGMRFFM